MSEIVIRKRKFSEVDFADPFFDSLKASYQEFSDWFAAKGEEFAYVSYRPDGKLQAFLYLKQEFGTITDITPPLNTVSCLKVGTFKIDAHGTRLGERFVKIIVDTVLNKDLRIAYITIFPEHKPLIRILETYGFTRWGTKSGRNGTEDVYVKDMQRLTGDPKLDYPVIDSRGKNKWLMAIYPEFHTNLFPDSILRTEQPSIIQDTSHTNSIHKVYVGGYRAFPQVSPQDCFIIYRCLEKDSRKPAWYKSVATSLCVVEEIRSASSFDNEGDFVSYCQKYSVFDESKLRSLYRRYGIFAVKMTYNLAFPRRPNLHALVDSHAVPHPSTGCYMGFLPLGGVAFKTILDLGDVHEGIVIH